MAVEDNSAVVEQLLRRGAASLELALPEGLVRWLDPLGVPVGWARCAPVLAYEPARRAAVWAEAWPGAQAWPATPALPGPYERRPVDESTARRMADQAARQVGRGLLRVPLGQAGNTVLYIAVDPVRVGDWPHGAADPRRRQEGIGEWVRAHLEALAEVIEREAGASPHRFRSFADSCKMAAGALGGSPDQRRLEGLAARVQLWSEQAASDPLFVAIAMRRELRRWGGGEEPAMAAAG